MDILNKMTGIFSEVHQVNYTLDTTCVPAAQPIRRYSDKLNYGETDKADR